MNDPISDETEKKAKMIGLTGAQLRVLVKPLFMALHKHQKSCIAIVRNGTHATIVIR